MRLVFLGTSCAMPTGTRNLPCVCLEVEREVLLFDAGEGAQISYLKAGIGWNKYMKIFVTHMHGDHLGGIMGLLQTMTMRGRTNEVMIYGPPGIGEFVKNSLKIMDTMLSFDVVICPVREGIIDKGPGYSIRACKAKHTVKAFSYLFVENKRPGRFHPEKAKALGVPKGKLWGRLQRGEAVTVNGRRVQPAKVMGKSRKGRRIGISGDTSPTKRLATFFKDCDYLVFDSTFSHELKERARKTGHSTAFEAATLAKTAGVKHLILTHFSTRYPDEEVLVQEAHGVHPAVKAARDLDVVEIK